MTATSVLQPTAEADHVLHMPLHHKPVSLAPSLTEEPEQDMASACDNDHNQNHDDVRKQYENMTYDEMSQRMAENYKQLSAMLGTSMMESNESSAGSTRLSYENTFVTLADDDLDDKNIIDRTDLDDDIKRTKMTSLLRRAAAAGDVAKVTQLLEDKHGREFIDLDAKDEDGTTPLIYAACFGKADIVEALLAGGAKTDVQDAYGWSALMWATNNNHDAVVKILLEHGASSQTKSAKGRTVFDFVNTDNQKIVEILATNPRDSFSSTSSIFGRATGSISSSSSNAGDCDFYAQSTLEGYDAFMAEESDRRRKLLETAMALADASFDDEDNKDEDNENSDSDEESSLADDGEEDSTFHWDKCLPDQMFVFAANKLDYILDTVITNIHLPVPKQEICVPANVVFLSARFAHYFSSDELLHEVLDGTMSRVSAEIKSNNRNVHVLAFWITNVTQLLYYLKKDAGLVVATADYQLRLSELISEIYSLIVNDTERRLAKILGPALLEYEQIPGMDDVSFSDDWQRFFRRSTRRSVIVPPDGGLAMQMKRNMNLPHDASIGLTTPLISPQSITSLLSSTLYVLHSYDVHPAIIIQALAQFFHFMSCETFNRILTNKKLLCRSKALQIRMNLSQIEDWIRDDNLPVSLLSYFNPTTQLLQLLQCLTQHTDLVSFIHTAKELDSLNTLQMKRCIVNYRYEVGEPHLPEEIEKYAMQIAEDTIRYKQERKERSSNGVTKGHALSRTQSVSMQRKNSRRESVSNFVGSLMSSVGLTTSMSLPSSFPSTPTEEPEEIESLGHPVTLPGKDNVHPLVMENRHVKEPAGIENNNSTAKEHQLKQEQQVEANVPELSDGEEEEKDTKEIKDSKFLLPFSVPTTAHMVSIDGWAPENGKLEKRERLVIPIIPGEWMERLDNGSRLD